MIGSNLVAFAPPDADVDYPCWYAGLIVQDMGGGLWVMEPDRFRTDEGKWLKYDGERRILVEQTDAGLRYIAPWIKKGAKLMAVNDTPLQAEYRRRVALRCLLLLQEAIEKNNYVYSGSMVPNFTSVLRSLVVPYDDLLGGIAQAKADGHLFFDPDVDYPGSN